MRHLVRRLFRRTDKMSNPFAQTLIQLQTRNRSQSAKSEQRFFGEVRNKVLFASSSPEFVWMIVEAENRQIPAPHLEVDCARNVSVRAPVTQKVINLASLI